MVLIFGATISAMGFPKLFFNITVFLYGARILDCSVLSLDIAKLCA